MNFIQSPFVKNHVLPLNYPPKFRHTIDLSAIVAGLVSLPVWTPLYLYGGTETITTIFWLTPCGTTESPPCSLRLVTGVSLDTCAVLGVHTSFVIWTPCISGSRRTQRSFIYQRRRLIAWFAVRRHLVDSWGLEPQLQEPKSRVLPLDDESICWHMRTRISITGTKIPCLAIRRCVNIGSTIFIAWRDTDNLQDLWVRWDSNPRLRP